MIPSDPPSDPPSEPPPHLCSIGAHGTALACSLAYRTRAPARILIGGVKRVEPPWEVLRLVVPLRSIQRYPAIKALRVLM